MISLRRLTNFLLNRSLVKKRSYDFDKLARGIHVQPLRSAPVRVRFAPSPTGHLHLGGFRTALLNYLFVLKNGGEFILRIEDTDQTRLVPEALENIEADLLWLGIKAAEGPGQNGKYGPYIQSQRLSLYQESLSKLIESGHAYECFCTEKRLDLLRREALRMRQRPRYDNKCRDLTRTEVQRKKSVGEQYCVRFKLSPEVMTFNDLVYGSVKADLTEANYEGDPVILKSDGFPTYHFANVVDDHYMEVTHVLRGVEWQVSTPKHLQLYRSFKWKPPEYAHLPLVMNKDGSKLSKRQGDVSVSYYRTQTFYPLALANFVTKSGGGFTLHDVERLYSMTELAENFDISGVNTGGCGLDFILLDKLNQLAVEKDIQSDIQSVANRLKQVLSNNKINYKDYPPNYLEKVLQWCPQRISKLKDLVSPDFEYIWSRPNPSVLSQVGISQIALHNFIKVCNNQIYGDSDELPTSFDLPTLLKDFTSSHNLKHKTFLKDLRLILCGVTKGPPVVEIFQLLGKDMICQRLEESLKYISANVRTVERESHG